MQEVILNLLPVTEEEKGEFAAIAPRAEHVYTSGSAVTAEELARATVIFGWPRPERLAQAKSLRWFQTMWAGTDEYAGHIPAGANRSAWPSISWPVCWRCAAACPSIGTASACTSGRTGAG